MRRPAVVLTVIAGAAVFLVVLLLNLPASWFAAALPAAVHCQGLGGSVWRGECLGLDLQGARLGDAIWNLAPGRALTGRLAGDFVLRGRAVNASASFDSGFSGAGELRDVKLQLVLDPAQLPQLPPEQRGTVSAELKRVVLATRGAVQLIEGTIELADLRQVGAHPMQLGSYQASFDGNTQPDGSVRGKVRDRGGPFIVEATLTLNPTNSYLVQGYITGRTAEAERVVREITLGAMPDASGRSQFSFEGSW